MTIQMRTQGTITYSLSQIVDNPIFADYDFTSAKKVISYHGALWESRCLGRMFGIKTELQSVREAWAYHIASNEKTLDGVTRTAFIYFKPSKSEPVHIAITDSRNAMLNPIYKIKDEEIHWVGKIKDIKNVMDLAEKESRIIPCFESLELSTNPKKNEFYNNRTAQMIFGDMTQPVSEFTYNHRKNRGVILIIRDGVTENYNKMDPNYVLVRPVALWNNNIQPVIFRNYHWIRGVGVYR